MTYGQLKRYIVQLRASGFHVVPYMVQLQRKVAFPFVTLIMTLLGSFVWSTVLAWFGARVLSQEPRLLEDPEALARVLKAKLLWFVAAVAVLFALYVLVEVLGRRLKRSESEAVAPE